MMTKIGVLAATVALVCVMATPARANAVMFDPTGGGGGFLIDVFDPTVGNSISLGLNATSGVGAVGTLLFQANLGLTSLNGSPNFLNGTGGNFFTIVAGITERITSTAAGTIQFGFAPGPNYFYIYREPAIGNNLTGQCFVQTGGACGTGVGRTLILSGTAINDGTFAGAFTVNTNAGGNLDQFGGDNYPAIDTVAGNGSFTTNIAINFAHPGYFPGLLVGSEFIFATSQQSLPYGTVNPSFCFSTNGIVSCTQPGAQVLSVGTINGLNGTNTMLQTDASLSFNAPAEVPEPATLSLLGLGLLGSVAARRRQLRKKNQQKQ